jgi:hypothetical protein
MGKAGIFNGFSHTAIKSMWLKPFLKYNTF